MRAIAGGAVAALWLAACGGAGPSNATGGESSAGGGSGGSTGVASSSTTGRASAGGTSTGGRSTGAASTGGAGTSTGSTCGSSPLTLDGLVVSPTLQLSAATVSAGQTLTGSFTLCNPTSAAIALDNVDIAARPPGGTDANGPFGDLYDGPGVTIGPGQSKAYSEGRPFTANDALGGWYAYVTVVDSAGNYHGDSTLPDNKVLFTVVAPSGGSTGSGGSASGGASTGAGGSSTGAGGNGGSSGGTAPSGLHVVNGSTNGAGEIVDGSGNVVQLHGADRSGTEFACSYEGGGDPDAGFPGFFDGPNDQAGIDQMLAWHINAVRVPLNEDCWLGLNGLPDGDTAADYQAAIVAWVNLLEANGLVAIVDLHWAAPGTEATDSSVGQLPMADADHAPAFWTSVATTFADNGSVIFDLFNEPYISDWGCWTSGAPASAGCAQDGNGTNYAVAGMATLLQAVRNAGANNVVILGGLAYSGDFSSWVSSVQSIPGLAAPLNGLSLDNVAASWHAYDFNSVYSDCPSQYNGYATTCATGQQTAANSGITGVLGAGFPVVIGEMGISAYSASTEQPFSASQLTELDGWLDSLMTYMEGQQQGYVAWSWNTDTPPLLITDYTTGAPTPDFGVTYQAHLSQL
ncbi:MAG TPA: cellulase family glycosylhydrolase [Myxococcales bacterium]|nr:cellulase family glycosylhydrolase [Myxococcales bacterium]